MLKQKTTYFISNKFEEPWIAAFCKINKTKSWYRIYCQRQNFFRQVSKEVVALFQAFSRPFHRLAKRTEEVLQRQDTQQSLAHFGCWCIYSSSKHSWLDKPGRIKTKLTSARNSTNYLLQNAGDLECFPHTSSVYKGTDLCVDPA